MMKKWKIGSLYIKGFADFKNGKDVDGMSVWRLIVITDPMNPDQKYPMNQYHVTLENIANKSKIEICQDDRYGDYALLDQKRLQNIAETFSTIKKQLVMAEIMTALIVSAREQ